MCAVVTRAAFCHRNTLIYENTSNLTEELLNLQVQQPDSFDAQFLIFYKLLPLDGRTVSVCLDNLRPSLASGLQPSISHCGGRVILCGIQLMVILLIL